jgi:hypothetical protein
MMAGGPTVADILSRPRLTFAHRVAAPAGFDLTGIARWFGSADLHAGFACTLQSDLRAVLYFCEDGTLLFVKRDEKLS